MPDAVVIEGPCWLWRAGQRARLGRGEFVLVRPAEEPGDLPEQVGTTLYTSRERAEAALARILSNEGSEVV